MRSSGGERSGSTELCPGCQSMTVKVSGNPGGRDCPFCHSPSDRDTPHNKTLRLPRVHHHQRNHGRGIGNSLSRFFQNFRSRSRRSETVESRSAVSSHSEDEDCLPPDLPSSSRFNIRKSRSVTNLPRIPTAQMVSQVREVRRRSSCQQTGNASMNHVHPFRHPLEGEGTSLENRILQRIRDAHSLEEALREAQGSEDFDDLATFYSAAFNSFQDINSVFHSSTPVPPSPTHPHQRLPYEGHGISKDCQLDLEFLEASFKHLPQLPPQIQKSVLKAIINSLLCDQRTADVALMRPVCKDDLRAYMVLLQYPQFQKTSTYVVYSHLLRQVATLCDFDHQTLAHWFTQLSKSQFKGILCNIQQFIGVRLFPARPQDLPPMSKCTWWIPCAVKNLAILNAANDLLEHVPFTDLYNQALDHWDLMEDFHQWQTPTVNAGFSFCQYPFILSVTAKKTLMEGHAEQQMIATARDSIIGTLAVRRTPDIDMLFLNITVRRDHLLADSLEELDKKQGNLRKKLRIHFVSEPGLDMGGLKKEWFQLLVRQIFHPDYGMFVHHQDTEVYWFSTMETDLDESTLKEYHLVGVLMGLAVYNSVILDIRFPLCCYKKLLSPAIVPRILDIHSTPLGILSLNLSHLAQISKETAKGLKDLLEYDGNVEEDFGLNFQISLQEFGVVRTVDLKPNGENIPVTNASREEYVDLYVDWYLNRAMERQFKAFYLGFHSVCSTSLLLLFRPAEIELLVCGSPVFDIEELKKVTIYDGYTVQSKTVRYFWDLVLKLPQKHQKKVLMFVTGSDRIPAGGMKELSPTFKVSKMLSSNPLIAPEHMLPMAHTCFNQIILPDYQSRSILRQKLAIALAHLQGFGLE